MKKFIAIGLAAILSGCGYGGDWATQLSSALSNINITTTPTGATVTTTPTTGTTSGTSGTSGTTSGTTTPTNTTPTTGTGSDTTTPSSGTTSGTTTPTTDTTTAVDPGTLPLIQKENIVYQGVFALPSSRSTVRPYTQSELGISTFSYGAGAIGPYVDPTTKKLTLFLSGHVYQPGSVAQVEVPATFSTTSPLNYNTLPVAPLLQKFRDITLGDASSLTTSLTYNSNGNSARGLLAHNGRLIFTMVNWYSYEQTGTHGTTNSLTLNENLTWSKFLPPTGGNAPPRAVVGGMTMVPANLQQALGAKALTGSSTVSIISAASFGPALSGFDPDSVVSGAANFPVTTLLYYPQNAPVCGASPCDNADNPIFNWNTSIRGFALVPDSNTILFVGSHGVGGYWYGGMTGPNGLQELPANQWQGPHSSAYEYRVWAYKISDLAKVKAGQIKPWDVKPYAIIPLPELTATDPNGRMSGSAYDPVSKQLFVAVGYGDFPRLYVYKVSPN